MKLDYLRVRPINQANWSGLRKNVELKAAYLGGGLDSTLGWHYARWLEGRTNAKLSEGCYGISMQRASRQVGYFDDESSENVFSLEGASNDLITASKKCRTLVYTPLTTVHSIISVLSKPHPVQISVELTNDWYDPDEGIIPLPTDVTEFFGAHSFATIEYSAELRRFLFINSWGEEWGIEGYGQLPLKYVENHLLESFVSPIPSTIDYGLQGIVLAGWKWSFNNDIQVHCREIVDVDSDDRIGWSFCTKRGRFLDVDEFFIWPTHRQKGYAQMLSKAVAELAKEMNLNVRLRVPYADTEPAYIEGARKVAKLFGLYLYPSTDKWCDMVATSENAGNEETNIRGWNRPPRPASPLEWLRKRDEKPLDVSHSIAILFGTNRLPSIRHDSVVGYSELRAPELHLGSISVHIDSTHKFGVSGKSWKNWCLSVFSKNPDPHVKALDKQSFQAYCKFLHGNEAHPIPKNLLYIHGFNNTFSLACQQAAQLSADLKVRGRTFVYSWPSAGKWNRYSADETAIEASLSHFESFMTILAESTSGEIVVVAHSMGNRLITRYLESAAIRNDPALSRIGQVVMAAPDIDTEVFLNSHQAFSNLPILVTLYASRADIALSFSELIHRAPRLGLMPPVVSIPGLDTILVEDFDMFEVAHSYFATASNVLHDIHQVFHHKTRPDERPVVRKTQTNEGKHYWILQN